MRNATVIALLVIASSGCGDGETPENPDDATAETATHEAVMPKPEPVEETGEIVIDNTDAPSLLGRADLRRSGSKQPESTGSFAPGDELELVVSVKDVPKDLAAWVHWIGPDGEKIAEEQKPVPPEASVTFVADTTGWVSGVYAAEIYVGGDLVETKTFEIVDEGESSDN